MNDIEVYKEQLFTFNNPIFFSFILFVVVILISLVIYIKIIFPLQKKMVNANQRYLLEKAELMALFAELDPDPLLRIDNKGLILQSNEAARQLFCSQSFDKINIQKLIPLQFDRISELPDSWIMEIKGSVFNASIRRENKLGFINIYLHDITTIKKYENQLEIKESNLRTLSTLLDKQSEDLKKSIASQIHDDIGQRMALLKLKANNLKNYKPESLLEDIDYVGTKIREISHKLVPVRVSSMGLVYSLKKIVNEMSGASGIEGYFETIQEEIEFNKIHSEDIKLLIINCVQEGLNNVIKHSQAKMFMVSLFLDENYVELEIGDNGIGIKDNIDSQVISTDSGIGLFRLSERVKSCGGEFSILSNEIYSTILQIKLPIGK